jgi:hypothetical protein
MLTAKQIKSARNLPPRLIAIGREIEVRTSKADGYHARAVDHVDSIKALLVEAKSFCDKGGLNAFRKRYCPSLGRSRAYELLAIASGKKSARQMKLQGAVRQARHVAKLKAAASALRRADRPLVTDAKAAPSRDGQNTVLDFTRCITELVFMTETAEPKAFNGAAVEADDLRKLADFLIDVADLRKPRSGKLRVVK